MKKVAKKVSKKVSKKASKKVAKKTTKNKHTGSSFEDFFKEEDASEGGEKEDIKAKVNEFLNSKEFDKALEFISILSGKKDKEIAEKIKTKVSELKDEFKVEELMNNIEKTVKDVEEKGKKFMQELNNIFKK